MDKHTVTHHSQSPSYPAGLEETMIGMACFFGANRFGIHHSSNGRSPACANGANKSQFSS